MHLVHMASDADPATPLGLAPLGGAVKGDF